MPERVPSDHASVTTYRGQIERSGGTRRPCLRLPDDVGLHDGDLIRIALGGTQYHARVDADASGLLVRGVYDYRRLARTPGEGTNRLVEWVEETGRSPDSAVELDEVEVGFLYGVRVPGSRVVYEATESPTSSLADIAEEFGRE